MARLAGTISGSTPPQSGSAVGQTVTVLTALTYQPSRLSAPAAATGVIRVIVRRAATGTIVQQGPWRPAGIYAGGAYHRGFTWAPTAPGRYTLRIEVRNPVTRQIVATKQGGEVVAPGPGSTGPCGRGEVRFQGRCVPGGLR